MSRDERIAEYLAGNMTSAQRAAFERDIVNDSEGLAELVAQKRMDAGLSALLDSQTQRVESAIMATVRSGSEESAVERVLAKTVGTRQTSRPASASLLDWLNPARWQPWLLRTSVAGFLAVSALIAWTLLRGESNRDADDLANAESREEIVSIARLTRGADVIWATDSEGVGVGAPLTEGTLRLQSGVVEIEFSSGAQVVLEGPAEFELISPMKSRLNFGKLSAQVPPQAKGFTVNIEGVEVTDLGTAFGVSKPSAGPLEVHVFTGKVEVTAPNDAKPHELTEGKALRFAANSSSTLAADRAEFVSEAELQRRESGELQARYEIWKKAGAELDNDAALLVHYNFDTQDDGQRNRLINRAPSPKPETRGEIKGCHWVEGRWPGKGALLFTNRSDRVRLKVPGTFESLTYAAWVSIDNLSRPNNALAMSQRFKAGDVRWDISSAGSLRLAVLPSGPDQDYKYVTGPRALKSWYRRWAHLAAVYDGPGKNVSLYLNGKLVASQKISNPVPLVLDDVELGNWNPLLNPPPSASERKERQKASFKYREFHGRMDEFVLLSRPLSADEIRRLYEAGKPRNETALSAQATPKK
jgi:hypothetical protein